MPTSITLYVETLEEEFEFVAKANIDFGRRARTYGPPEDCYPADPAEVGWVSFEGEGLKFESRDAFEEWISAHGATLNWEQAEESAIEKACEEVDVDEPEWDYEPYQPEAE